MWYLPTAVQPWSGYPRSQATELSKRTPRNLSTSPPATGPGLVRPILPFTFAAVYVPYILPVSIAASHRP